MADMSGAVFTVVDNFYVQLGSKTFAVQNNTNETFLQTVFSRKRNTEETKKAFLKNTAITLPQRMEGLTFRGLHGPPKSNRTSLVRFYSLDNCHFY